MNILRRIGLAIALLFLSFFLWVVAIDLGVVHEITQPAKIKQIIADSGLYSNALTTVFNQKDEHGDPATIKINGVDEPLNDPIIVSAANAAFPPSLIQQNVEGVIDSFNNWVNGNAAQPDFKVDLTAAKAAFAANIASSLRTHLASLPACTDGSTAATFNPFTATCIPKGVNTAATIAQINNDVANSKEFLAQGVYTANDIKDDKGQSVFANVKVESGRKKIDQAKSSPIFLGLFAVLSAVGVFFLSSTRRRGLRRIGIVLLIIGLITLAFAALVNAAVNNAEVTNSDPTLQAFEQSAIKAGRSFVQDLNHVYYPLSAVYIGLGAGLLVGSLVIRRGGKGEAATSMEPTVHKPTILDEPDGAMPDKELEREEPKKAKPKPKPAAKPKTPAKPKPTPKAKPKPKVTKISIS